MKRVTKDNPCPICGKPDWCGYSEDGAVAVCMRTPEGSIRAARNGGFVHRLRNNEDGMGFPARWRISLKALKPARTDLDKLAMRFERAIRYHALPRLAGDLGLSEESLRRLRIGWDDYYGCWTFPMMDCDDRVQGVRLRLPDGRKFSIKGGREGLFIPDNLKFGEYLLICEGPTDTAALLDLGFNAVGRPSCCGGKRLCVELFRRHWPIDAVIVADADVAGQRGADELAKILVPFARRVSVIRPPDGIKDAREWKRSGATAADIRQAINAAPIKTVSIQGVIHER